MTMGATAALATVLIAFGHVGMGVSGGNQKLEAVSDSLALMTAPRRPCCRFVVLHGAASTETSAHAVRDVVDVRVVPRRVTDRVPNSANLTPPNRT